MKGLKFVIESDNDFYHEVNFTTIIHVDYEFLIESMFNNLIKIHETFYTTRAYVEKMKKSIQLFINAYNENQEYYFDEIYDEVWFTTENNKFEFSFSMDNGNQSIDIELFDVEIKEVNGGYILNEKGVSYG